MYPPIQNVRQIQLSIKSYEEIAKIDFIPPTVLQNKTDSKTDQSKHILHHQMKKTNQNRNTVIVRTNKNSRTVHNNTFSTTKNNIHNICKNTNNDK